MKGNSNNRILALLLAVTLLITCTIGTTVFAADGGDTGPAPGETCAHEHDGECGYIESADCGHTCGEDCSQGCTHTQHDGDCGYIESAACAHQHNSECGDRNPADGPSLGQSGAGDGAPSMGQSGTITAVATPTDITMPLGASQEALVLPDALDATAAVEAKGGANEEQPVSIPVVSWACADYDPNTAGSYLFTPTPGDLPFPLVDGLELPQLRVALEAAACSLAEGFTLPAGHEGDCDTGVEQSGETAVASLALTGLQVRAADGGALEEGADYTYREDGSASKKVLVILSARPMIITGAGSTLAGTTCRIEVASSAGADLTLDDVEIVSGGAALQITKDAGDVMLRLSGTNILTSGDNYAGLQKDSPEGIWLTITSAAGDGSTQGSLAAAGGHGGAGIGGGREENVACIAIRGGTVTARGGQGGAGIGAGANSISGRYIEISGGAITATGNRGGAGIGGGGNLYSALMRYVGGGAGIGGGNGSDYLVSTGGCGEHITISGGTVNARGGDGDGIGDGGGAGIGAGGNGGPGRDITILGGTVNARGGDGPMKKNGDAPGIGYKAAERITLAGGTVTAQGGAYAESYKLKATDSNIAPAAGLQADAWQGPAAATAVQVLDGVSTPADLGDFTGNYLKVEIHSLTGGLVLTNEDGSAAAPSDYLYENNILKVTGSGSYRIAMTAGAARTDNAIEVSSACSLTLEGVDIDASARDGLPALRVTGMGSAVDITLTGKNALTGGTGAAGLCIDSGSSLSLSGTAGSLVAIGGRGAAGVVGAEHCRMAAPSAGIYLNAWNIDPGIENWFLINSETGTDLADYTGSSLKVVFGPRYHAITVSASPASGGVVSGGGSFAENSRQIVTAAPASGYRFVRWLENGAPFSTAPRPTVLITGERALTAEFEQISHIVTVTGGTGGGLYKPGESAAVPGGQDADTFSRRTLTDKATGISLTGSFTSGAVLTVTENHLHTEQSGCAACADIRARLKAGDVLALYNITLSGGYRGEISITFPVGDTYNGQTLTVLHCSRRETEEKALTVKDGKAAGLFTNLSPFALLKPEDGGGILTTPKQAGTAPGITSTTTQRPAGTAACPRPAALTGIPCGGCGFSCPPPHWPRAWAL